MVTGLRSGKVSRFIFRRHRGREAQEEAGSPAWLSWGREGNKRVALLGEEMGAAGHPLH